MTSDLWKLREWLTISEAARYLSPTIGQRVREADVLRLALDGHLKLSVNLPSRTQGRFHPEGADTTTQPTSVTRIEGLWDVSMTGAGRAQVEHDYHYRHNVRYFGLLAPRVKCQTHDDVFALLGQERLGKPRRLRWATSMQKCFGEDPLVDRDGRRMRWARRVPPAQPALAVN